MSTAINDLTILFISILIEALPFVLLGSLISSAVGLFVSDELFYRILPKNRFGGLFIAALVGLFLPVCDCTVIPVMRRLIRKGLPPSLGVTFMCAVPIVNPAVIASTAWAFTNQPRMLWLRIFVGVWTAMFAGFIVGKLTKEATPLRADKRDIQERDHSCSCGNHDCSDVQGKSMVRRRPLELVGAFFSNAGNDFFESGALIVLGALLSAAVQIAVPRSALYSVSLSPVFSVTGMMAFGYLLSLCSNADAFVAKSFFNLCTTGSIVAFMTFGAMIDLKNTIMLLGFFKKRFVAITLVVIAVICFSWGVVIICWEEAHELCGIQ